MGARRLLAVLLAIAAVLGITLATASASSTREAQVVDDTITSGCVIRFYTAGPEIHENETHTCDLATSVSVTGTGRLKLNGVSSLPIKSIQVAPDECLVQLGVTGGPSGGSGDIEIQMTYNGGTPMWATNDYLTNGGSPYCNLWVGATHDLP